MATARRPGRSIPTSTRVEMPLPPWDELEESFDGLTEEQLETFRRRAVPQPGGVLRASAELTNDARLDVPSTVVCTSFTFQQIRAAVTEGLCVARRSGRAPRRDLR
jgi:hypothetical protein